MPYNKAKATENTLRPIIDWIKKEYKIRDLVEDETKEPLPNHLRNSIIDRVRLLDSLIRLIKRKYGIDIDKEMGF